MSEKNKNGGNALFKVLVDAGIDVCFANPGTSEMQLVYEMGLTDGFRPVLCLQENIVTGAADGYYRMAGKPAFAMLHLGVGLANGLCSMHNARKAGSGMVALCGGAADYHYHDVEITFNRPLADLATPVADWVRTTKSSDDLAVASAEAVQVAKAGKVATLITPANHHWELTPIAVQAQDAPPPPRVSEETIDKIAVLLKNDKSTALMLGGLAVAEGQEVAAKIAVASGAKLLCETMCARLPRGAGRVAVKQIPYIPEMARGELAEFEQVIMVGGRRPMASLAYEGASLSKLPETCEMHYLVTDELDVLGALDALCAKLGAGDITDVERYEATTDTAAPTGELSPEAVAQCLTALIPENGIVCDESATMGMQMFSMTQNAKAHDWLMSPNGGGIGHGLPVALGAAVASPDRKVLALQADGCAMYTPQALWSIARENLDVTIVILKNDRYGILEVELARVRESEANAKMMSMLELDKPSIDWLQIAGGMGISATSATTAEEFYQQLEEALAHQGPRLIEAAVVQDLSPMVQMVARK
jgi:acetolactate synthase-1/2/3 large subunit